MASALTTNVDAPQDAEFGDYFELLKPRVMSLVIFTAFVGLIVAPVGVHPFVGLASILCVAVGAGASAALNMWWDADIDRIMKRTQSRPIPSGKVGAEEALALGLALSGISVIMLALASNIVAGALLAFTIFFYVAAEVIAGDTIGAFALSLGVANYSVMTSYTMAFMVTGYILGIILIPKVISQQTALTCSAVLGIVLSLAIVFGNSESLILANTFLVPFGGVALPDTLLLIAVLGLANAIVWPAVWPLALSGLGRLTSTASGLLVMGIAGGAIGPVLWGLVSGIGDAKSQQFGYIVLLPCYLFILYFALIGHKKRSW